MNINYTVNRLEQDDVESAVSLVRSSFGGQGLLRSIYRAGGISMHISNELKNPFSAYEYFVVRVNGQEGEELAGFCECRMLTAGVVCLNMIATAQAYKWCGIGSVLMNFCIEHYRRTGNTELILDVAANNGSAFSWYERKGFTQYQEKRAYRIAPMNGCSNGVSILNYPQYTALYSAYGFAHIDIITGGQTIRLGVIGEDIFINNCKKEEDITAIQAAVKRLGFNSTYLVMESPYYSKGAVLTDIIAGMRLKLEVSLTVLPDGRLQNRQG